MVAVMLFLLCLPVWASGSTRKLLNNKQVLDKCTSNFLNWNFCLQRYTSIHYWPDGEWECPCPPPHWSMRSITMNPITSDAPIMACSCSIVYSGSGVSGFWTISTPSSGRLLTLSSGILFSPAKLFSPTLSSGGREGSWWWPADKTVCVYVCGGDRE